MAKKRKSTVGGLVGLSVAGARYTQGIADRSGGTTLAIAQRMAGQKKRRK